MELIDSFLILKVKSCLASQNSPIHTTVFCWCCYGLYFRTTIQRLPRTLNIIIKIKRSTISVFYVYELRN